MDASGITGRGASYGPGSNETVRVQHWQTISYKARVHEQLAETCPRKLDRPSA